MSYVERHEVEITTDSSGNATAYSLLVTGKISAIHYVKDGSNAFSDGVDFAITSEATSEVIWQESNVNASKKVAPRQATHGTDGSASLYASGGTAVQDKIAVAKDRIKVVIAQGGDTKKGKFIFLME